MGILFQFITLKIIYVLKSDFNAAKFRPKMMKVAVLASKIQTKSLAHFLRK